MTAEGYEGYAIDLCMIFLESLSRIYSHDCMPLPSIQRLPTTLTSTINSNLVFTFIGDYADALTLGAGGELSDRCVTFGLSIYLVAQLSTFETM